MAVFRMGVAALQALRALCVASVFLLPVASFAASGLVGAWGLNGAGATTAADYSGNGLTGTLEGISAWTTAGKFGNALVFNGLNSSVNFGNPAALQLTGSMTVSAWIYPSAFPADDAAIVSRRGYSGGFQLDTTVDTGPRTVGFKLTSVSGADMIRYGATVLQANQWYHVAGVYDASAQTMTVYLNGNRDNGTFVGTVAGSQLNPAFNVYLGRRADDSVGYNFAGMIDEVRIYGRALSQAEIQADMAAAIVPLSPDTVAPSAPTNLAASPMSASQIHLDWTSSIDNYDVTGYLVERCQGIGCSNFVQVGSANDRRFESLGLAAGTSYSYRVRATDGAGNPSGYSNTASVATPATAPQGGRVGAYSFEEGAGNSTADASGFNTNGALVSSVDWTSAGRIGKALVFSGGYVDLGNPGTLQLTGSMTISAWVNSSAFPIDDAAILSKRGGDEMGFQLDTTIDMGPRTIGFKLTSGLGDRMARYGASTLQRNTWYHVAGVYDAQAQTLNVYLNGVLDNGPLIGTVSSSQMDTPLHVKVGARAGLNGYEFQGTIDEVRLYSRALSQAEIQADMSAAASAPPPDVIAPSAPSTPSVSAASATEIDLGWTASTDNVGVSGYIIERCQGVGCTSFVQIATVSGTSYRDTNVAPGTSYTYRVRAIDAAGNVSVSSSVLSVTTAGNQQGQLQAYYIVPDHLNTPRLIEDQNQTAVWRWDQGESFGNNVPNNNPSGVGAFEFPLRFPGQYFDRETGLSYNVNRDYDSGIGRYVESDPIGLRAGLNTYRYAKGNPVNLTDPLGLQVDSVNQPTDNPGGTPGLGDRIPRAPLGTPPPDPNTALENIVGKILLWCSRRAVWLFIISPNDEIRCDPLEQCGGSPPPPIQVPPRN